MFEKLLHAHKIRRLQAAQRAMDKRYGRTIERAKKAKESLDDLYGEWSQDSLFSDDEILQANSNFLRAEAERLFVPYPEWSSQKDQYEESEITGKWRLTQNAQAALRKAIRQERKEQAEQKLLWVPFMSLLTGLIGVVVAALAIIYKH